MPNVRLRHDDGRKAVTATNVSHFRAAFEFRGDAVQGQQPRTDEVVLVARAKKSSHGAEQALRLITPTGAFA